MEEAGRRLNDAIVNKVKKVLNNTDSPTRVDISIHAAVSDGVPTIQYNVEENILWGNEKEKL